MKPATISDTLGDFKEIQRLHAVCVAIRSEKEVKRQSSSDGMGSAHNARSNLNSVVDNQCRVAQDSSVNTGGYP